MNGVSMMMTMTLKDGKLTMTEQCWTATITKIDPIPNKDRIMLATIDGYQSIIPVTAGYQVGDRVCYISEQSVLPETLIAELGLTGKLAGSAKNRVKAIKMGGVLSQGIVCNPRQWEDWSHQNDQGHAAELDDVLGVTKWSPEIPIHLRGSWERPRGDAPIIPMYDIENIKKMRHWKDRTVSWDPDNNVLVETMLDEPYWDDPFNGHTVTVTEKIHGTNIGIHMNADHQMYVYSKGVGARGFSLVEDNVNLYWRGVRQHPEIEAAMHRMIGNGREGSVTVFGEVYGKGVQDMGYGLNDQRLALFGVRLWNEQEGECWIDPLDIAEFGPALSVPVLWVGTYDFWFIEAMAARPSIVDNGLREGVVVTSVTRPVTPAGRRNSAKFINPEYLMRGDDATEYN